MRVAIGADHTGLVLRPTVADAVRAANRLPGVRAAYAADHYTGHQMVEHDHVNVLTLGARVMGPEVRPRSSPPSSPPRPAWRSVTSDASARSSNSKGSEP